MKSWFIVVFTEPESLWRDRPSRTYCPGHAGRPPRAGRAERPGHAGAAGHPFDPGGETYIIST